MSFKKLLGIISVVILSTFVLMLTTSYAWYAFENGSTTFDVVTNNDNISVSFQRGEYINTSVAVPIASEDIDQYSEKNNFIVRVKDNPISNEMVLTVSLINILIDGALQNANFKVDLYHQNKSIASISGDTIGTSGATTKTLGTVVLDDNIDNNFEVRVYLLDDGTDQTALMNKSFQAAIKVDAVSRLKTTMTDYANADINISSITIDGTTSYSLPTEGYYTMTSTCTKGSTLTWEPLSKTITYAKGSYVGDSCSLTFTSSTDYPLLSEMPVGSYVKYTGTNGCDGKHCEGYNANYVSDNDMGSCTTDSKIKFKFNGWRIGYIQNESAYLISAGGPECTNDVNINSKSTGIGAITLSSNYYYGSGYKFNESTGEFTLTGVTSGTLSWNDNYLDIIANTPYTCKSTSSTGTCTELYEITEYYDTTQGKAYTHYNYDAINGTPTFLSLLDKLSLKYCNSTYVYGGVCNNSSVWNMDALDFQIITGNTLSSNSCYQSWSDVSCGYKNELIDNGSYYWFATSYNSLSSNTVFNWRANGRRIEADVVSATGSIRPVLRLKNNIVVVAGTGTYKDPYVISVS